MSVGDWLGVLGLGLGLGSIAVGYGVMQSRVAGLHERIANLESSRNRIGDQVQRILRALAVLNDREGRRSQTLSAIIPIPDAEDSKKTLIDP